MKNIKISQNLLIQLRKLLHKTPELSGMEEETAKRISGFLKSYNPTRVITGLGGHGVAAVFQYFNTDPTILIRCELDALPIEEINDFDHRSQVPGVAHKCGHDGHMAIVAGLATLLSKNRPRKGRVVLLFQPSEEDGSGAEKVINDENFQEIEPDYVFALHNLPGYAKHEIVCKTGNFTAAATSMILRMEGKTSHAGEPEKGINPAWAIGEMLQKIRKLEKPEGADGFALITPIQIQLGEEAFGTSAGYGELKLTLRTYDNDAMNRLKEQVAEMVTRVSKQHKLEIDISWTQSFAANINSPEMTRIIQNAAERNNLVYLPKEEPFRWGEDFGHFTKKYKGAMFGLGAGKKTPALHNPDYDFPDDIIPSGVKMFQSIIEQLLDES